MNSEINHLKWKLNMISGDFVHGGDKRDFFLAVARSLGDQSEYKYFRKIVRIYHDC